MTTVSVVECMSPVSLRSCGSSFSRLVQTRKRLQCVFPSKRSSSYKLSEQDLRDCGLEGTLISTPIPSPIPRTTLSLYGGRLSRNTTIKVSSSSSDEFCDDEVDEEILRCQTDSTPDLFVVGSKPRLHGMWEVDVPKGQPVTTPKKQDNINETADDIYDTVEEDRISCTSPQNPPPSPINFVPSIDNFVIGGQKLNCPQRCHLSTTSNKRDFNPGFFKEPLHNCTKCEGRAIEQEMSQVTLNKRLGSIMSSHASKQILSIDAFTCKGDYKPNDLSIQSSNIQFFSNFMTDDHKKSFYNIFTEKKRLKEEREFKMDEQIKRDKGSNGTIPQKTSQLKSKDDRKKIRRTSAIQLSTSSSTNEDLKSSGWDNGNLVSSNTRADFLLPPIHTKTVTSPTLCEDKAVSRCQPSPTETISTISAVTENAAMGVEYRVRRSLSDVPPCDRHIAVEIKHSVTDSEEKKDGHFSNNENSITMEFRSPAHLSSGRCFDKGSKESTNSTLSVSVHEQVSTFTGKTSKDEEFQAQTAEEEAYSDMKARTPNVTTSSTVIVPDQDMKCSQWVSFNGNNEPVLNTTADIDRTSDTFLKRLQRSNLQNPNDPVLPSGQQFCFEAMVDKRYNRWKRRRRRKQSESRRVSMAQGSESSDENDDRNTAMERIIDRMYEEIHGPAPKTSDGSRDTPRMRNRRRRKDGNSVKKTQCNELQNKDSSVTLCDASSACTSDCSIQSSSSSWQLTQTPEFQNEQEHSQPCKSEIESDDLCSWPYLEQYKEEILKRLRSTPPDELDDVDQNDWLPHIEGLHDDGTENNDNFWNPIYHNSDNNGICKDEKFPGDPQIISRQKNDTYGTRTDEKFPGDPQIISGQENDAYDRKTDEKFSGDPQIISRQVNDTYSTRTDEKFPGDPQIISRQENDTYDTRTDEKFPGDPQIISGQGNKTYDTTTDEYKPFIRGRETPRQSPVPLSAKSDAQSTTECHFDPTTQIYSYTKWSRSKNTAVKKVYSYDQPSGAPDLKEISRNPTSRDPEQGITDSITVTDKKMEPRTFRTLRQKESSHQIKDRLPKKTQKVSLDIKKQNVNLPGLSKIFRYQTISEDGDKDKQEKKVRPSKSKPKPTASFCDRPRTEPTTRESTGMQTVPELMFKDYYMRSLYGYKRRVNSHADSKLDRGTKKNLTVDSSELLLHKSRKTPDLFKPSHLAFTRSFSFSMFDLPEVYKLYNLTLESRATGDEMN